MRSLRVLLAGLGEAEGAIGFEEKAGKMAVEIVNYQVTDRELFNNQAKQEAAP
jgi:hypothetical protein